MYLERVISFSPFLKMLFCHLSSIVVINISSYRKLNCILIFILKITINQIYNQVLNI